MQYRTLGKTGLEVSVISFGAAPLGSEYRNIDESEGISAVHTALDLGVNFIDTSPYYGRAKSEIVLGKALRTINRDQYYLATKVGRYGLQDFDFTVNSVIKSVDQSLARLGIDYIDLIQCHDIEFGDLGMIINETIPALRKVQKQGKVRFIGITGLPLKIFCYVLERTAVDTILSYCHYALNDVSLESLIPTFEDENIGIINASALSMQLLTNIGAPDWHPADDEIKVACLKAAEHCRSKGADIAELGLQFALANPKIHTTLMGTANPENVKKNVACVNQTPDTQLLTEILEILDSIRDRTWSSGRPENN
ncbi:TPA: aldo/keto reductase [Candidatus Poribacteria bacterium]|nr:aldo/keto reductase [Candidatus Poribacteria bacterium]HIC02262.1 aldo/keto reductase [Candidatus Poribacteria bacterium]HIC17167.1 aldo/keto reductase [Candidatus Poribacteria bacterium]HIM10392.1 aldo/keto reductase [Candidatus Poribacteria bacterium]HIO47839.1 aldo/keto reductase [Candidatus Poribacteria bacterium]